MRAVLNCDKVKTRTHELKLQKGSLFYHIAAEIWPYELTVCLIWSGVAPEVPFSARVVNYGFVWCFLCWTIDAFGSWREIVFSWFMSILWISLQLMLSMQCSRVVLWVHDETVRSSSLQTLCLLGSSKSLTLEGR